MTTPDYRRDWAIRAANAGEHEFSQSQSLIRIGDALVDLAAAVRAAFPPIEEYEPPKPFMAAAVDAEEGRFEQSIIDALNTQFRKDPGQ